VKKKPFLKKLAVLAIIISAVAAYFFFYFIPSVEGINRYKRQVNDMRLKIEDFKQADQTFSFSSQAEERYFSQLEKELTTKIPEVTGEEEFSRLSGDLSAYIAKQAEQDGVVFKQIEQAPGGTLRGMDSDLQALVKGTRRSRFVVSFSGELKNALDFLNHLPWGPYYLVADEIRITPGETFPQYVVFVNLYCRDARNAAPEDEARGLIVDEYSEMLLKPIPVYMLEKHPQRELPREFGKNRSIDK
jgi:hypothetical protein